MVINHLLTGMILQVGGLSPFYLGDHQEGITPRESEEVYLPTLWIPLEVEMYIEKKHKKKTKRD